jgi:hypothetical protein
MSLNLKQIGGKLQQTCVKEPEIQAFYNSELSKNPNSEKLVADLIGYVKQQCSEDPTPIVTAYSVVQSSSEPRKKEILDILLRRQQEKSEPSAEEGKPRISEEALEKAREIKKELSRRSSDSSDDSSTQPQTGMSAMSNEERQKKIEEDRKKNLADYEAAQAAKKKKSAQKNNRTFRSMFGFGGNKTKKSKKGMSLCAKKTAKKCTKVRGCKVASGKKRTYCRKKKNHTQKSHKK